MRKHRFRSRIKSIVGSLIDPDKDEELKETNIETEDNYKKILELLKEENQDDKNKLTGLIEDFHNRYQSIYERYDNITDKLKEKVRSKKENQDSSSSSSGSDSGSDKESKNGKMEKVQLEAANREIEELTRKLALETEEKEALNLQYQSVLIKVQETEKMFNESKLQNSKLFAEKTDLDSKFEDAMANIEEEKRNNEELRAIKDGFESELEDVKKKLKISEEEKSKLIQTLKITEAENESLKVKVSDLLEEIEKGLKSKEQIVDELEETIEDLRSDLEIKGDEVNMLTETVKNLEVKIRLSNQKLRVTEQTLNETEHDHATKEQKLHEQNRILTEKIFMLSEMLTFVKREVQEKVNEMLKGFDLLTVKFEEDYGHVMTRVCEIRNEVKATEIQARVNRSKNEDFKDTVGKLSDLLEDVRGRVVEKDEKIKELEDVICVKDEEILCVCEGKREVIRQLCMWGDYQRDRFDSIREVLKPAAGGGRR